LFFVPVPYIEEKDGRCERAQAKEGRIQAKREGRTYHSPSVFL